MRHFWPALAALVTSLPPAHALDADAGRPYEFQVVLRVSAHRLLTPAFRQGLTDELRDGLQAALGPLARVEVLDVSAQPDGLWVDPSAVQSTFRPGTVKRHVVRVDFADGQYTLRARQLDGATGLASPRERVARTADRPFVGRQLLRFIHEDFGAVGAVESVEGTRIRLRLRGGGIPGAEPGRWVPRGSVFALVRITGGGATAEPVDGAYLRSVAEPSGGVVECELLNRFQDPLRGRPSVGYRAIRLGTVRAPLRLRVLDMNGLPQASLQVRVSPAGFRPNDPVMAQGVVRDGWFESDAVFDGLACVRVGTDEKPIALVPVPMVDDRVVEIRVPSDALAESQHEVETDARRARRAVYDILRRVTEQNRALKDLLREKKNREALEMLKAGLEVLDAELTRHADEIGRLRIDGRKTRSEIGPVLDDTERILNTIRQVRKGLERTEQDLQADVARANSPEARQEQDSYLSLLRKAQLHVQEAEFDEAIKTYEEILTQFGEREEVRKKLEELQAAWKVRGAEHQAARDFAYQVWAKLANMEDVRKHLPTARAKFDVLKPLGDRLTTLKLYNVATNQATKIVLEESDSIAASEAEVRELLTKQLERVNQELQALIKDMKEFLEAGETKK